MPRDQLPDSSDRPGESHAAAPRARPAVAPRQAKKLIVPKVEVGTTDTLDLTEVP